MCGTMNMTDFFLMITRFAFLGGLVGITSMTGLCVKNFENTLKPCLKSFKQYAVLLIG